MTADRDAALRAAPAPPHSGAPALLRPVELCVLILAIAQIIWIDLRGTNTLVPIGPVNLQVADLLMLAVPLQIGLMLAGRIRVPVLALLYVGLYFLNLGRGVADFGNLAVTAFRNDVAFILLLLTGASGGLRRIGYITLERILAVASVAIIALSLSRFAFGPNFLITLGGLDVEIVDDWNDGRTIGGPSVLILAITFIVTAVREFSMGVARPRLRINPANLFLLVMIAASGQRTASIGTVVVLLLMLTIRYRGLLVPALAAIPLLLFLVISGMIDLGPATFENVGQEMGGRTGTFAYRVQIWRAFLAQVGDWPAFDLLFGRPIGPRDELYIAGRIWTSSLHSAYLGLIPLIGLFGSFLFLAGLLVYLIRAVVLYLRRDPPIDFNNPELRLYGALVFLFYGVSYEWRGLLGLTVGILMAFVDGRFLSRGPLSGPSPVSRPAAPGPARFRHTEVA